jgi:hypothetical protein
MIRLEGGIEGERQRDRAGTLYFTLGLCSVQNVISCLDKNKGGGRGSVAVFAMYIAVVYAWAFSSDWWRLWC